MYSIALYERGHFCTTIGAPVPTLLDAIEQIKKVAGTLHAEELNGYFGYRFDRAGTECQIVILDRWAMPIKVEEDEV